MWEADASTPTNAKMKVAKIVRVPVLLKSGINACQLNWIWTGLPWAKYAIASPKKITDIKRIPITNPHLAIVAVYFVPPSCNAVIIPNITNTPTNFKTGLLFSAGQLKTFDKIPMIK